MRNAALIEFVTVAMRRSSKLRRFCTLELSAFTVIAAVVEATKIDTLNKLDTTNSTAKMHPKVERGARSSNPPLTTRLRAYQNEGNSASRAGLPK